MSKQISFTIESPRHSVAVAKVGSRTVGMASAWFDSKGDWVILQSEVRPKYRRRGIACAMYKAIEAGSGRQLKPAVSLSDDAFAFWKSFRPESVAMDLRHQPELVGCPVQKNGRVGIITKASGAIATIEFDDGDSALGTLSYLRREDLAEHLL